MQCMCGCGGDCEGESERVSMRGCVRVGERVCVDVEVDVNVVSVCADHVSMVGSRVKGRVWVHAQEKEEKKWSRTSPTSSGISRQKKSDQLWRTF